jgi:cation diffusion facilitator CzcD-associated flavoprotein CzcO/acetyl esterase/lipase
MALDRRFALLMWLAKQSGRAFYPGASVRGMRRGAVAANRRFGIRDPGGVAARSLAIPASDGATLAARLYRPRNCGDGALPVLLYFHGGGMVIGDIDMYDSLMRYIASKGRIAVFSVEYRLGPEHRFPRGHEDAFDAYAWLRRNATELNVDDARIAVGGDSAGGGLAAAIAGYAESRGLPRPAYALLIYPSVDGTGRFPSRTQYNGNLPLTTASVDWFMKHAVSTPADRSDPLFVPLDAPAPERHPPAYILAARYDPLVDEGRAYALRLREAGVRVEYDLRPTLPHAFVNFARVIPEARRALDASIAATAAALDARKPRPATASGRAMTVAPAAPAASLRLDAEVIIIGAGFGGLGLAIQLKKARRHSFIVLERAGDVGGTWRDNIYPGCACDIPAMLYSFSFERSVNWTRIYPAQSEILAYLKRTARERDLCDHIRLNSEVAEARFDATSGTWAVILTDGSILRSRILVSAMGPLNKPNFGDIPGRQTFAGPSFHSSQWDSSVDLTGKNVAVIGTGASAIQFVPQIATRTGKLTIFSHTPPWVIPRRDAPIGARRKIARAWIPVYARLVRLAIYWMLEIRALGFVLKPELLERQEADMRRFIARSVPDPALRAKVTPAYRAGCKRILISDDYYPALARANVELVAEAVTEIRAHSVVTGGGREVAADVIIYATGFKATEGFAPVRIYGSNGIELGDVWRDGMHAYLGTSVSGFPNLFLVIGPNTGLGHNSMIVMMEAQYRYILDALRYGRNTIGRALDVRPDVMRAFNDDLQRRMQRTVWATGCSSWYQDARGKNVSLWPGFTFAFRTLTSRFDVTKYAAPETFDLGS